MPPEQDYDEIDGVDESGPEGSPQRKSEKMNGAGFTMILMLALFKDFSDIFLDIGFITSIITGFTGLCISGIIWFYLFYSGVSFSNKKLATFVIMTMISLMPMVNILPETTVGLLVIRKIEQSERLQRIVKRESMLRGGGK